MLCPLSRPPLFRVIGPICLCVCPVCVCVCVWLWFDYLNQFSFLGFHSVPTGNILIDLEAYWFGARQIFFSLQGSEFTTPPPNKHFHQISQKPWEIETRFVLNTYRKLHMSFHLMARPLTSDNLEGSNSRCHGFQWLISLRKASIG